MRTRTAEARRGAPASDALLCLLAWVLLAGSAAAQQLPRPVSPGAARLGAVSEARCPTFSWSGVAGARGYRLAVFRVAELPGDEPTLVASAQVDGDARSFTPALGQCLERGQRYAWTVAALGGDLETSSSDATGDHLTEPSWAPALLFEVEGASSPEELERAIATLRRHLDSRPQEDEETTTAVTAALRDAPRPVPPRERSPTDSDRASAPRPGEAESFLPGALSAPSTATRIASAASTPTLGDVSLAVSNQIHLAAASAFFKDGKVFLWDDASGNTALGREALAMVSGDATKNTAVGRGTLRKATGGAQLFHGSYNTAVGDNALYDNTTGYRNTASGVDALRSNTTGYSNTASGAFALRDNSSGGRNTASGVSALFNNTTGSRNTASGFIALLFNTTGYRNTASGVGALRSNTTGYRNTANGVEALYSNTTGFRNTANGVDALRANTTAQSSTASGAYALRSNTTGSYNTASGVDALRANTTGYNNTASGVSALRYNTEGYGNTASGTSALRSNTTGYHNTAIGNQAGQLNTTGSYSIFINNPGSPSDDATIKIGTQGVQTSTFVAGISGVGVSGAAVLVSGTGQLGVASSSREVKRDISSLAPLAERLLELRPVSFRYRQLGANGQIEHDTPLEYGLVAEEVAEVFPELVIYDQHGKPQTVKYHLLGSLLLRALQEQQEELEAQRIALAEQHEAMAARHATAQQVQQDELASQRAVADRQRSELARLLEDQRALTRRLAALESGSRR